MIASIEGNDSAQQILRLAEPVLGFTVRDLLTEHADSIYQNIVAQPLLCAVQLATWRAIEQSLPRPSVFAGYSVGELAAYGCVRAISTEDMLQLAATRARAMNDACRETCRMAAIRGLRQPSIERLATEHGVYVSIVNDNDHFIVGGILRFMEQFEAAAQTAGAGVTPLNVSVASHTPLMLPAVTGLTEALSRTEIQSPSITVLSAVDGQAVMNADRVERSLRAQLYQTLDWSLCMQSLPEWGCTALLELGPGDGLVKMCRRSLPNMPARSVSEFRSLAGVVSWVTKVIS